MGSLCRSGKSRLCLEQQLAQSAVSVFRQYAAQPAIDYLIGERYIMFALAYVAFWMPHRERTAKAWCATKDAVDF